MALTADEVAACARRLVQRTTTKQGLPLTIDDKATLRRVAELAVKPRGSTDAKRPPPITARDVSDKRLAGEVNKTVPRGIVVRERIATDEVTDTLGRI